MHALRHVGDYVRELGPDACRSTMSDERVMCALTRALKDRQHPEANLSNIRKVVCFGSIPIFSDVSFSFSDAIIC